MWTRNEEETKSERDFSKFLEDGGVSWRGGNRLSRVEYVTVKVLPERFPGAIQLPAHPTPS